MILIAHRGNLYGPNPEKENKPDTIEEAINHGFYLGHDYPETPITIDFLNKYVNHLWVHCKHLDSLVRLKDSFNCFYHNRDVYTLTSKGYIWGNINSPTHSQIIQVMPEKSETFSMNCCGICTDYPFRYLKLK